MDAQEDAHIKYVLQMAHGKCQEVAGLLQASRPLLLPLARHEAVTGIIRRDVRPGLPPG